MTLLRRLALVSLLLSLTTTLALPAPVSNASSFS
jgi:hypothetical protein